MTDKEFKRLNRSELIDIIYQLQLTQEQLTEENRKLKEELAEKRIRMRQAGNIAEASLAICNVMESAQEAASLYLEEIRTMHTETKEKCRLALEKAQQEAAIIIEHANTHNSLYDAKVEAILNEYKQGQ